MKSYGQSVGFISSMSLIFCSCLRTSLALSSKQVTKTNTVCFSSSNLITILENQIFVVSESTYRDSSSYLGIECIRIPFFAYMFYMWKILPFDLHMNHTYLSKLSTPMKNFDSRLSNAVILFCPQKDASLHCLVKKELVFFFHVVSF